LSVTDNIIARHKGRDNTILFAMDEVEWRRIKGLPYLHYRQQFVEYWDEVYVKPGHYQRDDGHWLSQSHDNIFAWFRAFKVFNIADLSTKLIRELDMVGWQLFELDGKTQKKGGYYASLPGDFLPCCAHRKYQLTFCDIPEPSHDPLQIQDHMELGISQTYCDSGN